MEAGKVRLSEEWNVCVGSGASEMEILLRVKDSGTSRLLQGLYSLLREPCSTLDSAVGHKLSLRKMIV